MYVCIPTHTCTHVYVYACIYLLAPFIGAQPRHELDAPRLDAFKQTEYVRYKFNTTTNSKYTTTRQVLGRACSRHSSVLSRAMSSTPHASTYSSSVSNRNDISASPSDRARAAAPLRGGGHGQYYDEYGGNRVKGLGFSLTPKVKSGLEVRLGIWLGLTRVHPEMTRAAGRRGVTEFRFRLGLEVGLGLELGRTLRQGARRSAAARGGNRVKVTNQSINQRSSQSSTRARRSHIPAPPQRAEMTQASPEKLLPPWSSRRDS